jgi:endonuclease YncB( thermonuclease family)
MKIHPAARYGLVAAFSFAAGIAAAPHLLPPPAPENPLQGAPRVYDGDTISFRHGDDKYSIRLYGVDAPELRQTCRAGRESVPCGKQARDALKTIIGGGDVRCEEQERDRYGRYVAVCFNRSGTDIGGALIAQGWALEYKDYSDGRYGKAQKQAQAGQRGLWALSFQKPDEWRACNLPGSQNRRKGRTRP